MEQASLDSSSPFQGSGLTPVYFTIHFLPFTPLVSSFNKFLLLKYLLWAGDAGMFLRAQLWPSGGTVATSARSQLIMQRREGHFVLLALTAQLQHQNPQPGLGLPAGHLLNQFCHPGMGGGLGEIL